MDSKLKDIKLRLEEKAIKPTYIRLKILEYLEKHNTHPTAEDIYKALLEEIPTISRTSVYNTLNFFHQKGLAIPLFITGSETRYESASSPHHHFLCEKCGQIIDIEIDCPYFKTGEVDGHKIKEWHGYFIGICRDCLSKEKKNGSSRN